MIVLPVEGFSLCARLADGALIQRSLTKFGTQLPEWREILTR
jgi:hypothetical protein